MTATPQVEEPSAKIQLEPLWVLQLGRRDSLLVLKALGGRLDPEDEEEIAAARELGDRLTRQRAGMAKDLLRGLELASSAANGERQPVGKKRLPVVNGVTGEET